MIAADVPVSSVKSTADESFFERFGPQLRSLLRVQPLYRWQVWTAFTSEGLSALQAIALIDFGKRRGWIFEHNGLLYVRV